MSIRIEDQGIVLRLFPTEQEARKAFGAHTVCHYRSGWLVRNGAGRWMDESGMLPEGWRPAIDPAIATVTDHGAQAPRFSHGVSAGAV